MSPRFSVDINSFGSSIRRLSALNGKTQADTLLAFAKTTLKNRDGSGLIDVTPPASRKRWGPEARIQGEAAIGRDLNNIFAGVKMKGKQGEKHPDVEAIHRRHFLGKKGSNPLRSDLGGQKYFVDDKKLKALKKKLLKNVGKFAAGWTRSADRLGVSVPSYIRRHGTGTGAVRVDLRAPRYEIEMTLFAPTNSPAAELERRVRYALLYTQGRLDRAIAGTVAANARKAGLVASK